ncbi:hypothetical protein DQ04_13461000 [Trypanosoma grayi]|uniref:hypothetical protein n=1 Tax=Trypanosoma grayi TaxID=71804 RepID=UPI0004F42566|nr:hypothetical protein DQ04_13461000 [Trypanosoma grayi]KEG06532.1 hypothetical protein DQ04_13461000 [Trypanosoma grayi]
MLQDWVWMPKTSHVWYAFMEELRGVCGFGFVWWWRYCFCGMHDGNEQESLLSSSSTALKQKRNNFKGVSPVDFGYFGLVCFFHLNLFICMVVAAAFATT